MKRKFYLLLAATVCISMLSGCGADRGAEKNMKNSAAEETEASDAQEETKEAPPLELEKAELIETEEAEDDGADMPEEAYAEILDMFFYKILEGWDGTIYDLYTYADREVIHAATGGERFSYSLCEDGTIYYWQSSGAGNRRSGLWKDVRHYRRRSRGYL